MRITTWTEYSLIITLHLAKRGMVEGAQEVISVPVAARELAELERLPSDYVEQILLRLRRAGLVESVRGARGGYRLARSPAEISVFDVMTASEHQTLEMNCESHRVADDRCNPSTACSIRPVWQALQNRVDDFLGSVFLADLLREEAQVQELIAIQSKSRPNSLKQLAGC